MKKNKEQGIQSLNQAFNRYEQVNKQQVYRLSEDAQEDQFDDEYKIQVCDLSHRLRGNTEQQRAFAQQLGSALEKIGFAILINHGLDTSLYREAQDKIIEFFETVPLEERLPYLAQRQGSVNQGYFPVEETTIIHPDLVEGWVFCRRAFNLDNNDFDEKTFWPQSGFEPVFRKLVQAQETLILPIMQSILEYLDCDRHLYDKKLTHTNFGFRLNYYPPMTNDQFVRGGGRMLGHEDVDLFTFLPAPEVEGLQVLNRRNMKWIRLNAPPGSIVLNTGDYMQRISNDRLPSTTHRVSRPRAKGNLGKPRISFPMAIYVWEDEILEVLPGLGEPKYEPIRAEQFHTRITSKYYGDDYASDA
ncbi:MAG: 2-oxoglutarate and iron-dependent oxygenase domain-containing protein [Gammaproteobacteria bacterium]